MNTIMSALQNALNKTLTENGAVARKTTGSNLLNFFSVGGALRTRTDEDITLLFDAAFAENPEYALKALFYFRDIRGGQGERRTFRSIIKNYININHSFGSWLNNNVALIPVYGRWDDLLVLFGTKAQLSALELIKTQFAADTATDRPSLLGKWMPSENASSKETKRDARIVREYLGLTPRDYRKALTALRTKIGIVEQKISSGEWSDIEYSHVPSKANLLYRNAFKRHDTERYDAFIQAVSEGKEKINASALYPYDIVGKVLGCIGWNKQVQGDEATLNALWNSLPNYCESPENSIVVADVSGSMSGRPLEVSISLAIYIAERNKGDFYNKFLTFSSYPSLESVTGSGIIQKVQNLSRANWDGSTNIEGTFMLLLDTAIKNQIPVEDMIKKIYIISDMEFDDCAEGDETLFNTLRQRFEARGYELPQLVFWNVNARNTQFPMSMDDRGFLNVSGCSPSILKNLMNNKISNAYDMMIEVLDQERYNAVSF